MNLQTFGKPDVQGAEICGLELSRRKQESEDFRGLEALPTGKPSSTSSNTYAHSGKPIGWPIGPEKETGGGWYCPCRTVQLIERRPGERGPRYAVWTFFSNRRVDLRYPPIACRSRHHAFVTAYRRLEEVGGQPIVYPTSRALDLARSGDVVALECLR